MNGRSLDSLLETSRARAIPAAPANLEPNVWREIRLRSANHPQDVFTGFLNWILDRRIVTACLLAAILLGVAFNFQAQPITARHAMGLQVFSHEAYSPLVELARNS